MQQSLVGSSKKLPAMPPTHVKARFSVIWPAALAALLAVYALFEVYAGALRATFFFAI